ncbi:NAD(P)-dependent oxidoreductase [Dinoroseobacter sp. S375]|uniref:NAD(P)-dependent oxidoreductase n=1 Tax=Dinoroseobacter sp. S375 TaxID=3415136 RepID=UPI003C7AB723
MRLVVLGANGRTGRRVVQAALDRGYWVTAVVRKPDKRLALRDDRLRMEVADPCAREALVEILRGQDAVISTLGGRRPTRSAASVYWRSAEALVAATEAGVNRVVVTSSALLFPRRSLRDKLLAAMVRPVVRSAERMERVLHASGLQVTLARCGFLTDHEVQGYRATLGALPTGGSSVSRSGLAQFLVDAVAEEGSGAGHRVYGVAGPSP